MKRLKTGFVVQVTYEICYQSLVVYFDIFFYYDKKLDTFKIIQYGRIWNVPEKLFENITKEKLHLGKFQSPESNLQFQRHYKWTQYDFSEETWELDLQSKSDALLLMHKHNREAYKLIRSDSSYFSTFYSFKHLDMKDMWLLHVFMK